MFRGCIFVVICVMSILVIKEKFQVYDWLVLSYILCYRLRGRFAALVVSSVFVSLINGFVV